MTLPPDPTLFLAHCKAHKTQTQSQPCKELKMPTHSPSTPADEYLSSFIQYFNNISLVTAMPTHHPADGMSFTSGINKTISIELLFDTYYLKMKCSIYCTKYLNLNFNLKFIASTG